MTRRAARAGRRADTLALRCGSSRRSARSLLHAGAAALAVTGFQADESDDDIGAPAIEIALDMTAPRSEPTDLPPGPEAEASTASPAQVEQVQKVEKSELPKDDPIETENPDRVVSPDAAKKPEEAEAGSLAAADEPVGGIRGLGSDGAADIRGREGSAGVRRHPCRASARRRSASRRRGRSGSSRISTATSAIRPASRGASAP